MDTTPPAIEIRGMSPLLQVFDMPTTLAFYRDVLGFKLVDASSPGDDAGWVWLKWQGIDLMFNTAYENEFRPPAADAARVAAHSDTSIYFGCPDVDALYEYLRAKGVAVRPPSITGYRFKALEVKDPDNYSLVFHWPVE